jgi:L-cystine uptake protein TcyP (sodium:dicarboxylate symporter family)
LAGAKYGAASVIVTTLGLPAATAALAVAGTPAADTSRTIASVTANTIAAAQSRFVVVDFAAIPAT